MEDVKRLKDDMPRYTMRISQELLDKLAYIAEYEARTVNKQLEYLVKQCIRNYERRHGEIQKEDLESFFSKEQET